MFCKVQCDIVNVPVAVPLLKRHTCLAIFDMVSQILGVLRKDWKVKHFGVSCNGTRNMTGRSAGVVTHLESAMEESCKLICT